jgi:protease-4
VAHVDSVGQGRVWSGKDAREVGLVDSLGGLMEAVEFAKHEAGLTDCDYLFFPKPRTDFMSKLGTFVRERVVGVVYE